MKILYFICCMVAVLFLFSPESIYAHCDGLDGPVVTAAKKSLETEDAQFVLVWVQKQDEPTIRKAFEQTLAVRKLNSQALEMADHYFFETLVRIHRAGEGAPFTGLKPAGRDLGPAIPAADQALESGSIAPLKELLLQTMSKELDLRFRQALEKKNFSKEDVAAGREYVESYVGFIHFVEDLYESATRPAAGHFEQTVESHEH